VKGAENTAAPNMIVDEVFPWQIRQREDNPKVREEMRRRKLTEQYLKQRYNRKRDR
jgi:hypothetical protein